MIKGNGLIEHLLAVGPYFKEIFGRDLIVWVSDTDYVLRCFKGDKLDVQSDGVLAADDPMRIAMQKRQTMWNNMPAEIFGIPLKEIDNPIYDDDNNVIGCITVGISLDQETKVVNVAQSINDAVENMDESVREVAESAENIRNSEKILRDNINSVNELTKEISKVVSFTKRISDQTNLLGLNASIEAARAGSLGGGFGIVADQIRKLSIESMSIAKKIEALLIEINNANKATLEYSDSACVATEEQIAEVGKTKGRIAELKSISDQLMAISKEI